MIFHSVLDILVLAGLTTAWHRVLCKSRGQEAQAVEKAVHRPQQASSSSFVQSYLPHNHQHTRVAISHTHQRMSSYRAIDDLYTLAEMDGNLWQARNIVQLLDESTADFRQVSTRPSPDQACSVRVMYANHVEPSSCVMCSCKPFFRAKDAMTMAFMKRELGLHESLSHPPGICQCQLTCITQPSKAEYCRLSLEVAVTKAHIHLPAFSFVVTLKCCHSMLFRLFRLHAVIESDIALATD